MAQRTKAKNEGKGGTFSVRLSLRAKYRLDALAHLTRRAAYSLLEEAFWSYWKTLPPADREGAEAIAQAVENRDKTVKG